MTRNVRIKRQYVCTGDGCKFIATSRSGLQKHYTEQHPDNLKELLKASLSYTGSDYLFD